MHNHNQNPLATASAYNHAVTQTQDQARRGARACLPQLLDVVRRDAFREGQAHREVWRHADLARPCGSLLVRTGVNRAVWTDHCMPADLAAQRVHSNGMMIMGKVRRRGVYVYEGL